jgi:hypothetical protein
MQVKLHIQKKRATLALFTLLLFSHYSQENTDLGIGVAPPAHPRSLRSYCLLHCAGKFTPGALEPGIQQVCHVTSRKTVHQQNCYHREGHQAACTYGDTFYMLLFGLIQIVVSQIPDFHNMEWLSIVAALMSFTYSFIGFGLGVAKVIGIEMNFPSVNLKIPIFSTASTLRSLATL